MERPGYERFALLSNPFHDLASESLEAIETFHVVQDGDEAMERIKQEVLEKARKAFVLVVGPLGSGKTQRLRVTANQAERVGAFAHFLNLGEAPPDPVAAIAEGLAEGAARRKLSKGFSPPKWSKDLQSIAKAKATNPETCGRVLAEALNAMAPSYLLLNDLDAAKGAVEETLLHTLLALVSHLQPGVMVAISCQAQHFADLNRRAGPLMSRVNRVVELQGLGNAEAELLLAKRMAGKRLIDDLEPVYPFTAAGVAELNRAANGSPRRLLQMADLVLDAAVKERAFQIGPEAVQATLSRAGSLVEHTPQSSEESLEFEETVQVAAPKPATMVVRATPKPAVAPAPTAVPAKPIGPTAAAAAAAMPASPAPSTKPTAPRATAKPASAPAPAGAPAKRAPAKAAAKK